MNKLSLIATQAAIFSLYGCATPSPDVNNVDPMSKLNPIDVKLIKNGSCRIDGESSLLSLLANENGDIFVYVQQYSGSSNISPVYEVRRCKEIVRGDAAGDFLKKYKFPHIGVCHDMGDTKKGFDCNFIYQVAGTFVKFNAKSYPKDNLSIVSFEDASLLDSAKAAYVEKFRDFFKLKPIIISDEDAKAVSDLELMKLKSFTDVAQFDHDISYNYRSNSLQIFLYLKENLDGFLKSIAALEKNKYPLRPGKETIENMLKILTDRLIPADGFLALDAFAKPENTFSLSNKLVNDEIKRTFIKNVASVNDFTKYYSHLSSINIADRLKIQPFKISPIKNSKYGLAIELGGKSVYLELSAQCKVARTSSEIRDTGFVEGMVNKSDKKNVTWNTLICTGDGDSFKEIEKKLTGRTDAADKIGSWEISELASTDYLSGGDVSNNAGKNKIIGDKFTDGGKRREVWGWCANGKEFSGSKWNNDNYWTMRGNNKGVIQPSNVSLDGVIEIICN